MNRVVLKGEAKKNYTKLQKRNDSFAEEILKSFTRIIRILKINAQYGNCISKKLIPKDFKKQGITNIYQVEVTKSWRVLYTVVRDAADIYIIIVLFSDHKTYDNKMNY